ncbi:type I restriction enzyme, S subunit [Lachnospiraceae bacterium KH1T2]|nr:type I restriction enzyme, S subunit [Lachnospiraceae bacterium KH1T2]
MEYKALKDIATITMGQSPDSSSYNEDGDGMPFFQGNADFGEIYPNERIWCNEPKKTAEPGDILISVRAPIGALNYAKDRCCIGRGLAAITIDDEAERNYVFHLLKAKNSDLNNQGTGSTFKAIGKAVLEEVQVPQISREEQQKCMDIMDLLESIIRERRIQLSSLDELIKARFVELFGNVQNEEKYKGIPLRNLCITMSGGTPSTKYPEYYKGDIPWISTVSLGPNHIDGSTAKGFITQEAIENSATKLIPAGNILFGTRVGVGKSSLNDVDICTNQDIVAIIGIDEKKYNRLFIKHVLDSYQNYYDSIKKGATILGITADDLKDTLIPDAPIDIQLKFERFVEQVDKSKVAVQKSLDETQKLFDSLMQEYFG